MIEEPPPIALVPAGQSTESPCVELSGSAKSVRCTVTAPTTPGNALRALGAGRAGRSGGARSSGGTGRADGSWPRAKSLARSVRALTFAPVTAFLRICLLPTLFFGSVSA